MGAKEVLAQVVTTVETNTLPSSFQTGPPTLVDTRFSGCGLHCLINIPRQGLCSNTHKNNTHDPSLTFWTYILVRTILGGLTAASLMMFEGAVMSTTQELGGDYGVQRFVGNFGAIIFAPLGGYLIDISTNTSSEGSTPDFSPAIYIYLALKLMAAFMILFIKLDFKPPRERILNHIGEILKNAEVMMFLVMMVFAGTFWGYIESFLFWYLDDLGASKFLMGWTIAAGMITSLPFLIFSGPITDLIGHMNVIILGMVAYFVRLIGYSFLENPLFVYPYEALEGFTMALMMTSAVTYVAKIGTNKTIPSIMGIMGALFFGIGKGSGSLIGGILMHYFGPRNTFRYFSGNALFCAFVYLIFQVAYVRPKRKKESLKDLPSNQEIVEDEDGDKTNSIEIDNDNTRGGVQNQAFDNDTETKSNNTVVLGAGIVNGLNIGKFDINQSMCYILKY